MKTCTRCGRTYSPEQTVCPACGLALPGMRGLAGAVQTDPSVGHIEFLLAQLDEWVQQGWVGPEQARRLYDIYQERLRSLLTGPAPKMPAPEARRESPPPVPPTPAISSQPPPVRRPSPLAAFFEESNLSFWQLVGGLLLLAGLVGLVRWTWGSVGQYLVFALMLGLTGGLYALTRSRFVLDQPLTRAALTAVPALLVPLDIVAVNAFRLLGGALGTPAIGLLTSALCLPLYAWLSRREPGRWPAVLAAADTAVVIYFGVDVGLNTAHVSQGRGLAYGLAYAGLSGVFLLVARRVGEERRGLWGSTAYGATVAALAFAVWFGSPDLLGALAPTLLLLGLAYGVAAALFDDPVFAFLSLGAVTVGGAMALHRVGLGDWAARWYWYGAWGQGVGLAAYTMSRFLARRSRPSLAEACREGALALAGLVATAQSVRLALLLATFPSLSLSGLELGGMLLLAASSLGYFGLLRLGTVAASILAYTIVLLGLWGSHYAPAHSVPHDQPNLGLLLSFAAVLLWRLRRPRVSLIAGALGLLLCAVYALMGIFWETTVAALPLLVLIFVGQRRAAGLFLVWPAAASTVLEVLLLEQRILPWAHTHWGWEQNYGLGLFPVSLVGLALGDRLKSSELKSSDGEARDWTRAALVVIGATALLQLGEALSGLLPYSPLCLLGAGAFLSSGLGLARRSPRAADCAVGLTLGFYLVFALGSFFGSHAVDPRREVLTAGGLFVLAALFVLLARSQKRPSLVYAAAMAFAIGEAHGLHQILHPAPVIYALALWPVAAGLYAFGTGFARRGLGVWQMPLHRSALVVSFSALTAATAGTLLDLGRVGSVTLLGTVCLYGVLYAAVAAVTRNESYAELAALVLSGAYGLALLRVTPALSPPRLAFFLSLGGLVWLVAARFTTSALNRSALAVGLSALVIACLGLGGSDDRDIVYTLLVAGTTFLGAAWGLGAPAWGSVGVAAYFLAYFAYLTKRLGAPGLPNSDFYLVPAGSYILALGLLARQARRPAPQSYFLTGLLLILTPTLVAAWPSQASPLHSLLLLTECVAALFYGIAARIKVFVGAGLAFLVALILRETQGFAGHVHWAVYATGLGLAILASALFFEKRGEEVRRWTRAAQEKLRAWD